MQVMISIVRINYFLQNGLLILVFLEFDYLPLINFCSLRDYRYNNLLLLVQ